MANVFKNAFHEVVSQTSGSPTVLLTCPSSNASKCVVIGMHLTNTGSSQITADVILEDASQSNQDITLLNAVPLPASSVLSVLVGDKIILEEGDKIKLVASANTCNGFASYLLTDNT